MEHFADFGAVKQANKLKKKTLESAGTTAPEEIWSKRQANKANVDKFDEYTVNDTIGNSDKYLQRGVTRKYGRTPVRRNPKSFEEEWIPKRTEIKKPDFQSFTDVRPNSDSAIDATHLGFRKDPYKGYGGMMEEPVDMINSGAKSPKARIKY